MSSDIKHAGGEEYNPGATTEARQAATVILLRGAEETLEALLVKRTPKARFMGGVWVFPGGAVEPQETERTAAIRELREEAGITLADPAILVRFSRWITPAEVKVRFDTHFFLAPLPPGQEPKVDGEECVDLGWFTPQAALEDEQILLVFPTIKHLEQLAQFSTASELLREAAHRKVLPIQPRVILEEGGGRVVLPGEPGY
jgi:8-oxo-dGTP pyrophosphatase MutT (NUDIX family)